MLADKDNDDVEVVDDTGDVDCCCASIDCGNVSGDEVADADSDVRNDDDDTNTVVDDDDDDDFSGVDCDISGDVGGGDVVAAAAAADDDDDVVVVMVISDVIVLVVVVV